MKSQITQVPFPGGSGNVPSGALQFQNDWPGLFLRGDTAISLHSKIRGLEQRLANHPDAVVQACLFELKLIADTIERDVVVR
jgi:hypothetical protein